MEDKKEIPNNFFTVIADFASDLSQTYPEHCNLWSNLEKDADETVVRTVFEHCVKVYPERFFDILYQNEDIFKEDSEINVEFLPNTDFKLLYTTSDVSENTQKTIWKYLQLILFTVVGDIKDKTTFGECMNIFEGIDETELQSKLTETMSGITDFFKNIDTNNNSDDENPREEFKNMENMPNMENMHEHLQGLFHGKIGSLAQEMAEEISGDFGDMFQGDMDENANPQDIIKKLMSNPKRIMDLMKKVSGKLDKKMKDGDISRDEIMKEAGELMGKMKDMGGGGLDEMMKNMAGGAAGAGGLDEMMKNMAGGGGLDEIMKNLGGGNMGGMMKKLARSMAAGGGGGGGGMDEMMQNLGGEGMGDMLKQMAGSLGKNMKLDTNAIDRMTKQSELKEQVKQRGQLKKEQVLQQQLVEERAIRARLEKQQQYMHAIEETGGKCVFRMPELGKQEQSTFIHPDLLKEMEEEDKHKLEKKKSDGKKKKKKKNKK